MRSFKQAAAIFFGGVFVGGAWLAWSLFQPSASPQTFDRFDWSRGADLAASVGDPGCVRGGMALDLIESQRLSGSTRQQVLELLGTPNRTGPELVYALGQCSGFGWEDSELVLRFDTRNRVSAVRFQRAP